MKLNRNQQLLLSLAERDGVVSVAGIIDKRDVDELVAAGLVVEDPHPTQEPPFYNTRLFYVGEATE